MSVANLSAQHYYCFIWNQRKQDGKKNKQISIPRSTIHQAVIACCIPVIENNIPAKFGGDWTKGVDIIGGLSHDWYHTRVSCL